MATLLIDNSNTRTKFILADEAGFLSEQTRTETKEINYTKLDEIVQNQAFDKVFLCSVVPEKAALIEDYFSKYTFKELLHDSPHGIKVNVDKPEQVGADRLANAIGVHHLFNSPAIVIDFGTAVTFDVIAEGGIYEGGVIAPGLGAMNDYLAKRQ